MITSVVALLALSTGSLQQDPVPVFTELGGLHRKVSTENASAQRYFDQGLAFLYGFNMDEARRAFEAAAKLDPNCGMAWWGIAMASGPHLNATMVPEEDAVRAWSALAKAKAGNTTAVEKDLIDAAYKRFSSNPNAERPALDIAYSQAMVALWKKYPNDIDVAALACESEMILHPWDLHFPGGKPKPWTEAIIKNIQRAYAMDDKHPLILHLYIHAVEGSTMPYLAEEAADTLLNLQPDLGHMVHMPSHIFVRVGRWDDAIESNKMAIEAEKKLIAKSPQQDDYVLYMTHNNAMLAYAAMMCGRSKLALDEYYNSLSYLSPANLEALATYLDGYEATEYEVMIRFGEWDKILATPDPGEKFPINRSIWHMARSVSWAAKGDVSRARMEQALFYEGREAALGSDSWFYFSPTENVLKVAEHMMNGEIRLAMGDLDKSIVHLKKAVAMEDQLVYIEPPDWLMPTRHALGAVMIKAGKFAEAEAVYRADMAKTPESGWALYGLSQALRGQGKEEEALVVDKAFNRVWAKADIPIESSCKCVK